MDRIRCPSACLEFSMSHDTLLHSAKELLAASDKIFQITDASFHTPTLPQMLSPLLFSLVLLSHLTYGTWARTLNPSKYCLPACTLVLDSVVFNDTAPKDAKCYSQLRIHSMFLCTREFCTVEMGTESLRNWNETCHGVLPSWSVIQNYTTADIDALRKIQRNETDDTLVITEIVLPSDRVFKLAFDTIVSL
jgi:hypothetical protein